MKFTENAQQTKNQFDKIALHTYSITKNTLEYFISILDTDWQNLSNRRRGSGSELQNTYYVTRPLPSYQRSNLVKNSPGAHKEMTKSPA